MSGLYIVPRPDQTGLATPVPLHSVSIQARIIDLCTQTTIIQQYCNRQADPIEGVWTVLASRSLVIVCLTCNVSAPLPACV